MTAVLALWAVAIPEATEAQKEYEAYLARFDKCPYITGAMMASGGPVGNPTVSTFRLWNGGMFTLFKANVEEHYDGKTHYVYSPEVNKYLVLRAGDEPFAIAFGLVFAPTGVKPMQVESAEDGVYDGRKARIFAFKPRVNEAPSSMFVRKDKGTPLAIVWYGQQAQYTISFPELHLDRKVAAPFRAWSPPSGASRAEFLPGGS